MWNLNWFGTTGRALVLKHTYSMAHLAPFIVESCRCKWGLVSLLFTNKYCLFLNTSPHFNATQMCLLKFIIIMDLDFIRSCPQKERNVSLAPCIRQTDSRHAIMTNTDGLQHLFIYLRWFRWKEFCIAQNELFWTPAPGREWSKMLTE